MNIISSFILFVGLLVVYLIIVEIFTVLFRITGMEQEEAHFQVISLLTNSGYTTSESENITISNQRKNIAKMIMLFGYAFTVTIVSSIVNVFLQLKSGDLYDITIGLIALFIGLVIIVTLTSNRHFKVMLDNFIEKIANRCYFKNNENHLIMLDSFEDNVMAEVHIDTVPFDIEGKNLKELDLQRKYKITIMLIKEAGGDLHSVNMDTIIEKGSTIIALGNPNVLKEVFNAANECACKKNR